MRPAQIRDEMASAPALAGFDLNRAATRIAERSDMHRQLRMRAAAEDAGYDLKAMILALPVREQALLIRDLAGSARAPLTEFIGSDDVVHGCDSMLEDIAFEDAEDARRGRL